MLAISLLALGAALWSDKPSSPLQGSEGGVSDAELFTRIVGGFSVIEPLTFQEAARKEPRRIDARIQQAIYQGLVVLFGEFPDREKLKQFYCYRNNNLRVGSLFEETGNRDQISVGLLADEAEQLYKDLGKLVAFLYGASPEFAASVVPSHQVQFPQMSLTSKAKGGVHRAFTEAAEVARAAARATTGEDQADWNRYAVVLEGLVPEIDSWFTSGPPQEMFGDRGEWEKFILSGHRAPSQALPAYRRMGGRAFA